MAKGRKKMAFFAVFLIIILVLGGLFVFGRDKFLQQEKQSAYQQGLQALSQKDYAVACSYFEKAGDYSNSEYYYKHTLAYSKSESAPISAKVTHTAVLRNNGTVVCVGYQEPGSKCLDTSSWNDIYAVSTGFAHTVGLRTDGTVVASEFGEATLLDKGQCDVDDWEQIVQISANSYYTLGLKQDGTVVFAGDDKNIAKAEEWKDIIAISAGGNFALGLKSDGTVVSTKIANKDEDFGQTDVESWENITQISAGQFHAVGVCDDGSVKSVGKNDFSQTNVSSFKDIAYACAAYNDTYMITKDGKILSVGMNSHLKENKKYTGVKAISGGYDYVCLILQDGKRVAFGENTYNQCAIEGIQE